MKPSRRRAPRDEPTAPPNLSVFINCPYDADYLPLFDAIVFATTACGFIPRCALESGTVALPRMDRIFKALSSSKYSIHDLTRCRGEGDANLARFNMPLEFGIAFGKGYDNRHGPLLHDWLVLVPEGRHLYARCVSDLGGYDPQEHGGTVPSIVPPVIEWLATRPDAGRVPDPRQVLDKFPKFATELSALREKWSNHLPWAKQLAVALKISEEAGF